MINRMCLITALGLAAAPVLRADVIQLRDKAAITGTILAEKKTRW